MRNRFLAASLLLSLALGSSAPIVLSGCASSDPAASRSIGVAVNADGSISVSGRKVPMKDVVKALKSRGAVPATVIQISIPKDVSQTTLAELTKELASGGFTRIVFTKPPAVSATVSPAKKPAAH